jgi:hypothetical protein
MKKFLRQGININECKCPYTIIRYLLEYRLKKGEKIKR